MMIDLNKFLKKWQKGNGKSYHWIIIEGLNNRLSDYLI